MGGRKDTYILYGLAVSTVPRVLAGREYRYDLCDRRWTTVPSKARGGGVGGNDVLHVVVESCYSRGG